MINRIVDLLLTVAFNIAFFVFVCVTWPFIVAEAYRSKREGGPLW